MKPEGVAWQCTFDDEFNGTSVDTSLWRIQETSWNGFHSGSECFENSPNNVSVAGGVLRLTTRKEAQGFLCQRPSEPAYSTPYTSGMLTTYGKFTQAYGRWEIRAKFPSTTVKGVQSSFWLWPQDPHRYGSLWPQSGEIDMAEFYSQYPDRVIPYVHYVGSTYRVTNNNCMVPDPTAWHTYLMVWTREFISMTIDGQPCLYTQVNPTPPLVAPAPFDQPFMLSLTQALGIQTNAFDENSTPLPATTTIDYVRVWK
jgi:beta-glucanase (GH16 family)